jgi:hypothetical protein
MILPVLQEMQTSREWTDAFLGYNHNLRIGEGEFYDMENLSSDNFPLLSPRKKRGTYATPIIPQGLVAKDTLCYISGGDFVFKREEGDDIHVPMNLTIGKKTKTLISMGAYVIVMPDKKYINTIPKEDGSYEWGNIEALFASKGTVTFSLCRLNGSAYDNVTMSDTAPPNPKDGTMWLDTSSVPKALKVYSSTNASWSAVATTYVKIAAEHIDEYFSVNDGVRVSGITVPGLEDLNASAVIWAKGDGYIVVSGIIGEVKTQNEPIKVERKMPEMDFIVESGNRLWGCRYGEDISGEIVNTIYASKLGDFKNWESFSGIASDSWYVSLGSDGAFTGAITYLGYPLFFKETCVHKVYGNYPSNYTVQTTPLRGVQNGCGRSLAIVNEVLYYKARGGICAYDGSLPVDISSALGDRSYGNAVAGTLGNKYYISMQDTVGAWHMFVYDTKKVLWHREDDAQAVDFCSCRGDLYYIDYSDNLIKSVCGAGVPEKRPVKWWAITGIIGTDSPDKKYVSRMEVRMKLGIGARVSIFAEYDSSGEYEHLVTTPPCDSIRSFPIPIKPKRCDHMRLKISGVGDAKIFSICKTTEWGSDV